ncbi:MAG: AAA family ATPase [Thermofilaceae archaeon]
MVRKRRLAILVSGMPGSGKTVFADVAKKMNIHVVSMGDAVRLEAIRRRVSINSDSLSQLAVELRRENGPTAVAELTMKLVQSSHTESVVIEGVRSLEEVNFFKDFFDEVVAVAIHSSPKTRFSRVMARRREDDPVEWGKFVERDYRELELGIGAVIALSDYVLVNEDIKKEEFETICGNLLNKLLNLIHE